MKKQTLILLATLEASLFLLAVYFEPTYRVRGTVRGEAFFEGRPTSYWRCELEQLEVTKRSVRIKAIMTSEGIVEEMHYYFTFNREQTWFEKKRNQWLPEKNEETDIVELFLWVRRGPPLLRGDPEAKAVLRELLDDPSPKIRSLAQIGLGMNPNIPVEADD